ncbi:MAG: hypothetical protein ACK55I_51465, partial [bacterium]
MFSAVIVGTRWTSIFHGAICHVVGDAGEKNYLSRLDTGASLAKSRGRSSRGRRQFAAELAPAEQPSTVGSGASFQPSERKNIAPVFYNSPPITRGPSKKTRALHY